jgi:hypothetical protein
VEADGGSCTYGVGGLSPTASMPLSSSAHLLRTGGYCNADDRYTEKMDLRHDLADATDTEYGVHPECICINHAPLRGIQLLNLLAILPHLPEIE